MDNKPGVVSALKFRVLKYSNADTLQMSENWNDLLLTSQFDDVTPPQVEFLFRSSFVQLM